MAEPLRIATFGTDLSRDGPGLLLRDILSGHDDQVAAVVAVLAEARADVLLLTGIDYDHGLAALGALADLLEVKGLDYPHRFALRPNRGMQTGLDLDGDGRRGGPDDAQGFGRFAGAGGMAVLSRLPVMAQEARDFSGFLWRDLPGALLPDVPAEARAVQRLSTTGHWEVPLRLPGGGSLRLLAWHAAPPVFGLAERNARRNHDETAFWLRFLSGELPIPPPGAPFVLLGNANLDPEDGDGMRRAIRALLAHPTLQDPRPGGAGGMAAPDADHRGDPALDTAAHRAGNLRVTYVLPSAGLTIADTGVLWPAPGDPLAETAATASRHRLVWVDLLPP
ncbi:MAG: endonuclease/exonuclease/phosphatase family protein [Gemmobacter sp.]